MNGKECDPKEFLTRVEHDNNCPAKQEWWREHFTEFMMNYNEAEKSEMADKELVKMMNPMNYIGTNETTTAKYWRIRHGAKDNDTAIAISTILAAKLQNNGYNVDYAVPWGQGHGGDYDLNELFDWMDKISKQ